MARTKFPVEVLTPDGEVFSDEIEMLSTRTAMGSIGVLANHAPLLATLDPCELRLFTGDGDPVKFAQGEGYLQVIANQALVLVEEAIDPSDLDTSDLDSKLSEAQDRVESSEEDTEERRRAERDVRRWEAFKEVAGGS
ncbi:MAG: ATP synthase F1 subunit epsilon [Thermoleophilaceae bacterium]|nr:ATP synthase F1 subunit epsilon [Thermoleophilaceae bacterium]MBA3838690.1 ATP synthase F1 subunit epsilon [Thermoleophilaceae bacterium]